MRKEVLILSLAHFTKEQLEDMSLVDMAYVIIESNNKETVAFMDIMNQIVAATGMSESEVKAKIAQFYTDMNIDGRFLCLGDNRWGLRNWYKVEQAEEDTITQIKPKKGKKKRKDEDDLEDYEDDDIFEDDFDEFEDEDLLDEEDDLLDDLDEDEVEEDFEDEEILEDDEEVFDELDEVDDELEEGEEEEDELLLDDEEDDL
jgi:DNA-directed RNA polymerase subunit delta